MPAIHQDSSLNNVKNYKFNIRFGDTDSYGIVHHRNFYHYFEEARFRFSKEVLDYDEESNIKFPLIESYCRYQNPIRFTLTAYTIEVECRLIDDAKIEFNYRIFDEKHKRLHAFGRTVHVYVDENNKMHLEIPKDLQKKILNYNNNQRGNQDEAIT